MKKAISFILLFCLLLTAVPSQAKAVTPEVKTGDVVVIDNDTITVGHVTYLSDGSVLIESVPKVIQTRSYVITSHKTVYHRDSSDNLLWSATLTGTFTYNGSSSSCTAASCSTSINDSAWSQKTLSTYTSGSSANADVTMVKKILFVTVETVNVLVTLTCDKDGHLY